MGLVLGLIGGGGSILTVPILVYLFGVEPVTATAYSLFIVGTTAAVWVRPATCAWVIVHWPIALLVRRPSIVIAVFATRALARCLP